MLLEQKMTDKECIQSFFSRNKRLLIVDDTVFNIEGLSYVLKRIIPDLSISCA